MAKSYFAILGISPGATGEEVKSAFRKLAKEFHPDRCPGSNERFRQIQEAYAVLADRRKRREYEEGIRKTRPARARRPGPSPAPEPLIPEKDATARKNPSPSRSFRSFTYTFDIFLDRLERSFLSPFQPAPTRRERSTIEITLTPEQARRGGTARVLVPARAVCPACGGYGKNAWHACARCAGRGAVSIEIPLAVPLPPGLARDYAVLIPLDRYGIPDSRLTVVFRPLPTIGERRPE